MSYMLKLLSRRPNLLSAPSATAYTQSRYNSILHRQGRKARMNMTRTVFFVLGLLLCASAASAADGSVGTHVVTGVLNHAIDTHQAATNLVTGLVTKTLSAQRTGLSVLVQIVNSINNLSIATMNHVAGVTNEALTGVVSKIKDETLFIGNIYTDLLGEFGRFVGGSVNAIATLKKGLFVSPLALKAGALEHSLSSLITFLEAAVSEGGPSEHWGPYINILQGVKTLLATLKESFNGPLGGVGGALDVATSAANDVLGFSQTENNTGKVFGLVDKALGLVTKIPGVDP